MARSARPKGPDRPAALPPEQRTVGQLVAESIRLYGRHFLRALPLGLVVAVPNQLALDRSTAEQIGIFVAAAPLFTLAFADASRLATGARPSRAEWLVALAVGVLLWLPAAALLPWFKLAVVVWLGALGLAVPAALAEGTSFGASLRRGIALGRVDYVHAVGSLAALVVMFGLAESGLALLLESQADNTVRVAIFLADAFLGPLLFLGGALLYVDQDARLRSSGRRSRRKERGADVSHADDAHGEGSPDAPRQPRATA
jgi:hypothetical protein